MLAPALSLLIYNFISSVASHDSDSASTAARDSARSEPTNSTSSRLAASPAS